MENQLKNEQSPYLKQHKDNPVYWLAWNKESLKKAKEEKKPIFLSVGYASCHWCHVMAHESFENNETAKIMNEKFINIKVDREERPDLDFIFQKSLSILTGAQGGWPLSMFLDENAVPFTGGTYFPPQELQGRPSFNSVLENVSKVYQENRDKILNQADQMKMVFRELNKKNAVLKQDLEPYVEKIINYTDEINGGFKGAPKFPQFYIFDTILHFYNKTKNKKYLDVVEKLLISLSSKGIYDHLEGGIARYTVDEKWIVPHFEKMLYDNIQYISLLTKFYQNTNSNYFKKKLIQTINFLNRDFINESGLYGSAYDADSEGVEGKFYIWTFEELKELSKDSFELLKKKYSITSEGNFEGRNILVENKNELTLNEDEKLNILENELLLVRNKRIKPLFDDKSQTDQNAFLIDVLLNASIILNDNKIKNIAISKFEILQEKLKDKFYHCYQNNEVGVFLEDYVFYSKLLMTLYEIESDQKYLDKLIKIMNEVWEMFYDEKSKLLQKNQIKDNDLFVSPIDLNDNNIPNGNSIYLDICNKLYSITNDKLWFDKSKVLKKSFHQILNSNFSQMFSFIKILDICNDTITFTFYGNQNELLEIKNRLLKEFLGRAVFIYKIEENSKSGVVICKNQTCSNKISGINEINAYLIDQGLTNDSN